MLGFLFGVGLTVFVLNRVRGGGFRGRGFRRDRPSRRSRRRGWMVDRLASRLDTTAAQERALADAIDGLFDAFHGERDGLKDARDALADALRADTLDAAGLDRLEAQQGASLGRIHAAVRDALSTAHAALDGEQRAELADMVARGPHGQRCHGRRAHLHAA